MTASDAITDLHLALAHSVYEGFPEIEYEDRDWEHYRVSKEDRRITKKRKHTEHDITVLAMFPQTWSSTALGFGGLGGAAMTTAYTIVLESNYGLGCCVYFQGKFAYRIDKPNDRFFQDINNRQMVKVKEANDLYQK